MSSQLSIHDAASAQWCPHQEYFDLLVSTLRSRGEDETALSGLAYQGRHPTRANTSDMPLSDEARELYKVATGSSLVTWSEAVRWVEEQGRTEENILFNQLYTFAWVRPATPRVAMRRFNPKVSAMEVHDNLYDLADVAKLIFPARRRALADGMTSEES